MLNFLKTEHAAGHRGPEAAIPKLREIAPEYGEIVDHEAKLNGRLPTALAEMKKIAAKTGNAPPSLKPTAATDASRDRLKILLNGFAASVDTAPDPDAEDAIRFWRLHNEVQDIQDKALPLLAQRRREVARQASAVICEQVADHHRALVREMAATLRELHAINARYWTFADALAEDGVAWAGRLGPAFFRPAGHPGNSNGPIAEWFEEAARFGHISEGEIPQDFRR